MPSRSTFLVPFALAASSAGCSALDPGFGGLEPTLPDAAVGAATGPVDFGRDIRPLMNRHPAGPDDPRGCGKCHYATAPQPVGIELGGLDLTTLGSLRRGGATSGAKIVIPGDPDGSILVQKLRGTYPFGSRMPRNGPPYWTDAEIGLVRSWIAEGAKGEDRD